MATEKQLILTDYILSRLGFEKSDFLNQYLKVLYNALKNYRYLAAKKAERKLCDDKYILDKYKHNFNINDDLFKEYIKNVSYNDDYGVPDELIINYIRNNQDYYNIPEYYNEIVDPDLHKKYEFDGEFFVPVSFSILDYLMIEYKSKKDKNFINKINTNSIISATDLANYTYCPVSYSIEKTFETDILKNAAVGSKLHEENKLLNWISREWNMWQIDYQKEIENKDESNKSFFDDVRMSTLLYSGHNAENETKYFFNKARSFVGQPDYVFQNKDSQNFIVEEKFRWGRNGTFERFYNNHKVQLASYIYGLEKFNADYGYLIYWYYDFQEITSCKVLKISRTSQTRDFLNNSFLELTSFIKNKKINFNNDNLNPKKCANCVVNRFCGHKTGKFQDLEIPYSNKYLKLMQIPYPEELKKDDEDIPQISPQNDIKEKPKFENLKDLLNSIDWDSH
jgi:CRISPR/Cas system-associated exonuclease Cas4 (RecB family)